MESATTVKTKNNPIKRLRSKLKKLITKHSSSGPASPRRGLPQAVRPKGKKPANHLDAEQSPLESAGGSTIPAFVQLSAPEAASVPQGNACIKLQGVGELAAGYAEEEEAAAVVPRLVAVPSAADAGWLEPATPEAQPAVALQLVVAAQAQPVGEVPAEELPQPAEAATEAGALAQAGEVGPLPSPPAQTVAMPAVAAPACHAAPQQPELPAPRQHQPQQAPGILRTLLRAAAVAGTVAAAVLCVEAACKGRGPTVLGAAVTLGSLDSLKQLGVFGPLLARY